MVRELRIAKTGGTARIFLTLLLLGGSAFFVVMGIFATQASLLDCPSGPDRCARVTRYPFGVTFEETVPPIRRASVRAKSETRGTSLNLTLHHPNGPATEYPGVGTNGDRAAKTAEQIRGYIADPRGARSFPLRSGSRPVGWGMVLLGLAALVLLPGIFNGVVFSRRGDELVVRVERRPRGPREERAPAALVEGVHVQPKLSAGRPVLRLALAVRGREPVDLEMVFADEDAAWRRVQLLDAQLAPMLRAG